MSAIAAPKLVDVSGAALAVGWGALATATASVEGLSTSYVIFAACAGSGTAVLFRLTDSKRDEPGRMWAKALRHSVSFITGATVGVFMGSSLTSASPLDEKGGIFIAGLLGHAFVAVALSDKARGWIARKLGMSED